MCAYCMCDAVECLVQCAKTGRYFCNGLGRGHHSHIVHHLVKAHETEIVLPEANQYSKIPLVCYNCKTANVFQLGFVQSRRQGTFFVLCRDCMKDARLALYEFDEENRQQLVSDNSILPWVVRHPTHEEELQSLKDIENEDMDLLEDCWSKGEDATIRDVPAIKLKAKLPQTQLTYARAKDFSATFSKLVEAEMKCEKETKESMMIRSVPVRWEQSGLVWIAHFRAPASEAIRTLSLGDDMILEGSDDFSHKGTVVRIGYNDVVDLKVIGLASTPPADDERLTIKFTFNDTPYKRQLKALKDFEMSRRKESSKSRTTDAIKEILLGKIPKTMQLENVPAAEPFLPGFKKLNDSQVAAINCAVQRPLTLIQGPPGTGKTTTIAGYVYHCVRHNMGKVLVCGPSNITVEHLTRYIAQTGVRVVRLMSRSLDGIPSCVENHTVSTLIYKLKDNEKSARLKFLNEKRQTQYLPAKEEKEYDTLRDQVEREICQEAEVVCCTAAIAGSATLEGITFSRIVIDEATQAVEPMILMPILHDSKQVVLVGDHLQLGPTVMSSMAKMAGLEVTTVQRLVQLGMKPVRLEVQYRMHPALSEFPSNFFYDGVLINGVSARDRTPDRAVFPWPQPAVPMFFFDNSQGEEERSDSGTSYINRYEAYLVCQIVAKLCKAGVNPNQIGVVTPYAGQCFYIRDFLRTSAPLPSPQFCEHIQVASVDSFQGAERDYIILSCVRCNRHRAVGFLNDPRRLNVAVTRAKMGLIIIGSARVLSGNRMWYALIKHFQSKELLVAGEIDQLRPSPIVMQPPGAKKDVRRGVATTESGRGMVADPHQEFYDETIDEDEGGYFFT